MQFAWADAIAGDYARDYLGTKTDRKVGMTGYDPEGLSRTRRWDRGRGRSGPGKNLTNRIVTQIESSQNAENQVYRTRVYQKVSLLVLSVSSWCPSTPGKLVRVLATRV
jgi:hypothetical protein